MKYLTEAEKRTRVFLIEESIRLQVEHDHGNTAESAGSSRD